MASSTASLLVVKKAIDNQLKLYSVKNNLNN